MNDEQAHGFAVRYRNTWRGGPGSDELARLFARFDAAQLGRALDRLATTVEYPPSLAALQREYDGAAERVYEIPRPEYTGEVISPAEAYACNPELAAWRARRS